MIKRLQPHRKLGLPLLLLVGYFGLQMTARFLGENDWAAVVAGRTPRFASGPNYAADGGSTVYFGVGYKVGVMHRKAGQWQKHSLYRTGPCLEYWPVLIGVVRNRDQTQIVYRDADGSERPLAPNEAPAPLPK